jgi:MFS transporter, YNFM family, putative membrane transport protein
MDLSPAPAMPMLMHEHRSGAFARTLLIGLIAFLTVIDLFGTQAILPALTNAYGVTPAAMGFAVNATTMGMAVSGLGVAYFSRRIDRRRGILVALTLLALPTALLAIRLTMPAPAGQAVVTAAR